MGGGAAPRTRRSREEEKGGDAPWAGGDSPPGRDPWAAGYHSPGHDNNVEMNESASTKEGKKVKRRKQRKLPKDRMLYVGMRTERWHNAWFRVSV